MEHSPPTHSGTEILRSKDWIPEESVIEEIVVEGGGTGDDPIAEDLD